MQSSPIKLLLIEDNPDDVELVQLALQKAKRIKFETTPVEQLGQALPLLYSQQFDAILLDLSLPDCNGLKTLSQVKKAAPHLPIVILSGLSDEGLAIEAVKLGAQDYLIKGQGDHQLIGRALCYAMERKQTEIALRRVQDELEQRIADRTTHLRMINYQLQREISQRKHTEELLRKERDFTSAILDTADVLVAVLDCQGRIVRLNRAFQKISGYSLNEVKGRYFWDFTPSQVRANQTAAEKHGPLHILAASQKHEEYWQTKTGEQYLIAWSSTALLGPEGSLEYIICTGVDITERRQAEDLARQRLLELAHISRLSTLGEMAAEIAHELNQPLGAITTYSDICLRILEPHRPKSQSLRELLEEIAAQAERAGKIIHHLRNFICNQEQHRAPVEINILIRETVDIMEVEARWQNITIELALQDSLPPVIADSLLLQQVLINLIRNAFDAMSTAQCEERKLKIQTLRAGERAIEVHVQDTGPGLSDKLKQKIFEPFFTTKQDGMGIGLSICQSIIEAHGGQLWVTSNNCCGTTFRLRLPLTSLEASYNAC